MRDKLPPSNGPREDPKKPRNLLASVLVAIVIGVLFLLMQSMPTNEPLTMNELDKNIADGQVDSINIYTNLWRADVKLKESATVKGADRTRHYFFAIGDSGDIVRLENQVAKLRDENKATATLALAEKDPAIKAAMEKALAEHPAPDIKKDEASTVIASLAQLFLPVLLLFGLVWFLLFRQMRSPGAGGSVLSFGKSRAMLASKDKSGVSFKDVAGIEEAKDEVKEVIEFLRNPEKFKRLGGRIPRGILLVGPPGCGKTLLAKAIAGEAGVPFYSICGSDFVEMFVGVGASRVRDLFKQAKEKSPCIVFLDEIDAVGRKRGSGMGGGHDEREQTLNAILVEMDGFDTDEGVIVLASTNRPDVLDPALLRPGRFDRQVVIDLPDVRGREEILKVHARDVKLSPGVDINRLARGTPMFTGAELEAIINEGAILAAMRNREFVGMDELEEARDKVRWGRKKVSKQMEEEDRRITAYHEAGHALVTMLLAPEVEPLHRVTIIPRGMSLGATMHLPAKDQYHMQKKRALGELTVFFAGRISEDLCCGDISAGASNDIERASELARRMVCEWGMSDEVGPINYREADDNFLGREGVRQRHMSDATAVLIDKEVKAILDLCYKRAEKLLTKNRDKLEAITKALMKYESLSGKDCEQICRGEEPDIVREREALARGVGDMKPVIVRPELEPPPLGAAAPA